MGRKPIKYFVTRHRGAIQWAAEGGARWARAVSGALGARPPAAPPWRRDARVAAGAGANQGRGRGGELGL